MFETLFGNETAARVLFYLHEEGAGYANGMSRRLKIPLNMVQKQLEKLETAQLLKSKKVKRKKYFYWNVLWPLHRGLREFLSKKDEFLANQLKDPDDGTHLSIAERVFVCEGLYQDLALLNPNQKLKPFVKTFDCWKDHEAWDV